MYFDRHTLQYDIFLHFFSTLQKYSKQDEQINSLSIIYASDVFMYILCLQSMKSRNVIIDESKDICVHLFTYVYLYAYVYVCVIIN